MTKEEQRIALAEWMGYVWYRAPQDRNFPEKKYRFLAFPQIQEYEGQIDAWKQRADGTEKIIESEHWKKAQGVDYVPNYPNDLNAIHEAEKKLTIEQSAKYEQLLDCVVHDSFLRGETSITSCDWHASSEQRSEALCRILWPERFKE
jgi:hypothetical protein